MLLRSRLFIAMAVAAAYARALAVMVGPADRAPLLPRRVGREDRVTAVLRVEDGSAERDEGVGHVVVPEL